MPIKLLLVNWQNWTCETAFSLKAMLLPSTRPAEYPMAQFCLGRFSKMLSMEKCEWLNCNLLDYTPESQAQIALTPLKYFKTWISFVVRTTNQNSHFFWEKHNTQKFFIISQEGTVTNPATWLVLSVVRILLLDLWPRSRKQRVWNYIPLSY